jgi:hypothetical protein
MRGDKKIKGGQMFQFLIGRLKTRKRVYGAEVIKAFQFLIGRLKT